MNDEKEVQKISQWLRLVLTSYRRHWETEGKEKPKAAEIAATGELFEATVQEIKKILDAHGKSCYERGREEGLKDIWESIQNRESFASHAREKITRLKERVVEAEKHEEQTHKILGEILGTDTSLEDAAKRMKDRLASSWEKRTVEEVYQFLVGYHKKSGGFTAPEMHEATALVKFLEEPKRGK